MLEDSSERVTFDSGATRDIQPGKGRPSLLPGLAMIELSKHCEDGAAKYGDHNWAKGVPMDSFFDSAFRHLMKWKLGMEDEDHLRAAAWNVMFALETRERIKLGLLPKELDNLEQPLKKNPLIMQSNSSETHVKVVRPRPIARKRVLIINPSVAPEKDGMILIKPGLEDINLGPYQYAPCRINIDDTWYIKGMAIVGTFEDFEPCADCVDVICYGGTYLLKVKSDKNGGDWIDWDNPFDLKYDHKWKPVYIETMDGCFIQTAINIVDMGLGFDWPREGQESKPYVDFLHGRTNKERK